MRKWATALSSAIAQLHWGSALVIHQMFSVISLLKVVTKPQRVKRRQSINQSSLCIYIYIYIFFIFHYSQPYVTVFSVWIVHCLFLLIPFIAIFNFNDIQLLRILFRTKLYFLSVKRKTARRVHYSEKPRSKNALPSTAGSVIGAPVFILTPSDCCLKLW